MDRTRGQAHALEAFTAALLLLAGLLFAMQSTAVTPLSASTSNQHLENQQRVMATDLMAVMDHTGALEDAVLNWSNGGFGIKQDGETYTNPSVIATFGRFGDELNRTLLSEGSAVNIDITYRTANGTVGSVKMIEMGTPTDNAIVATRTIILADGDELTGTSDSLGAAGTSYFVEDASSGDPLYTILEVRIVVWQN